MKVKNNLEIYRTTEFLWAHKDGVSLVEDFILKSLESNKSVLDAGTGGGRLLHILRSRGFSLLVGFDYCEEFIKIAKKRDPSGTIRFDVANAGKLPYEDGQFDQSLYLQQVLCFIEEKQGRISALRELNRVLKRDGVAYISLLFRNSRERTVVGFLFTCYLRFLRLFLNRRISLSLQPWLRRGGRFNWAALIDDPPRNYWYSLNEAMEDIKSAGLVVKGIATDNHLKEGRWLSPDDLKNGSKIKGVLYMKCGKN